MRSSRQLVGREITTAQRSFLLLAVPSRNANVNQSALYYHYHQGINARLKNMPIATMPRMSGVKNPHTG